MSRPGVTGHRSRSVIGLKISTFARDDYKMLENKKPVKTDVFSNFADQHDAKMRGFSCSFEGDNENDQREFVASVQEKKFKIHDLGLSTIDCWGPDPDDCAYGHQFDVTFPRERKMSKSSIKAIEKAIDPFRGKTHGPCHVRYSYTKWNKKNEDFFYGSTVAGIKKELEDKISQW